MVAHDRSFDELLGACTRSLVHLEMRDGYMRDDPLFAAWQDGYRADPADRVTWWRPFHGQISDACRRGVMVRRARIISEPISDYIRFEYDLTFQNLAAGEQVRWLPRRDATEIALPGNDFWLFDTSVVLINHFSGDGLWFGSEVRDDTDLIKLCASAFDAVWARAIPHADYRPL